MEYPSQSKEGGDVNRKPDSEGLKGTFQKVQFLPRKQCGMAPQSKLDCSSSWIFKTQTSDFESHLGKFDILYCIKCKMGLTHPYPSEETAGFLYQERTSGDFDIIQESLIDRLKDWLAKRLLRKISPMSDFCRVQAVLDYSCGNGRFAFAASELFLKAEVDLVDYQSTPPPLLNRESCSRLHYLPVEQFVESQQKYDLILLRHVLEHTHDPIRLITLLASRLKTNGTLYIEVPNLRAGCAKVFGAKWKGYYVPRHIFHYTEDSLYQIITASGLQGNVEKAEMPLMGNMIAILFDLKKENLIVQLLGVFLHPIQLAIEFFNSSSTCLQVKARLRS